MVGNEEDAKNKKVKGTSGKAPGKGKKQGDKEGKKNGKGGKNNKKNKEGVEKDVAAGSQKQGKHFQFLICRYTHSELIYTVFIRKLISFLILIIL